MIDEPFHGDFQFDLQEKTVAAQHHALQDVQRHLLNGRIGRLVVDKAGDLSKSKEENQVKECGWSRWEQKINKNGRQDSREKAGR